MKRIILIAALAAFSATALADTYVKGYTRSDGTQVQGHTRSGPNSTRYDNKNSQSNGGSQRDEYSPGGGATNRSNPGYGSYDNDRDGTTNAYDPKPGN